MKWYSYSKEAIGLKVFEYEYDYEYRDAEYEKLKRCPTKLPDEPCASDIK